MKLTSKDFFAMLIYVVLYVGIEVSQNTSFLAWELCNGMVHVPSLLLMLSSYHLGWKKGLIVSLIAVTPLVCNGWYYTIGTLGFVLGIIGHSVYGIASLFPNYKWFYSGVFITNFIRYICILMADFIILGYENILYEFMGLDSYMVPMTILSMILVPMLYNVLKKVKINKYN